MSLELNINIAILSLLQSLLFEEACQTLMGILTNVSPLITFLNDFLIVRANIIDAVPLELLGIMRMGQEQNLEGVLLVNVRLQVLRADVDKAGQEEEVSHYEQSSVELPGLVRDEEVVRVDVLDQRVEHTLFNVVNLDDLLGFLGPFSEP